MNKKEIFEKLNNLEIDKKDFIVLAGASLVVQKVKTKTNDIDISVTKKVFNSLKEKYQSIRSEFGYEIINIDCFEISTGYYDEQNIINVDVKCSSLYMGVYCKIP